MSCGSFLANILPVLFVLSLFVVVWSGYVFLHLLPNLQLHAQAGDIDLDRQSRAYIETFISSSLTFLFCVCYMCAVFTHPGSVPDDPAWTSGLTDGAPPRTFEMKNTGERRHCKWCKKYKPDRCHHCRICKSCVLKMDHHCPWIMNCIGFRNHKFFFLLVIYATTDCLYIAVTIMKSVIRTTVVETTQADRFLVVLSMVIAMIMATMTGLFFSFHAWLMMNGMTTIEFCEKQLPASNKERSPIKRSHSAGAWHSWTDVFGRNPLLWFVPISTLTGDGLHYPHQQRSDADDGFTADPEWTGNVSRQRASESAKLVETS